MGAPADVDIPLATSGSVYPASGISGYDGPWLEETQSMHYFYMRVPRSYEQGSHALSLSGYVPSVNINSTHLIGWVEAQYTLQKTYNNYAASTPYTQPQKFELDPSPSGPDGTVYQDQTIQASAGQFGAMGIVRTKQPYIRRQLWDTSDVGSEVSQFKTGATHSVRSETSGMSWNERWNFNHNFLESWTDYTAALGRHPMVVAYCPRPFMYNSGQWAGTKEIIQGYMGPIHPLNGTYSIGQETNTQEVVYAMNSLGNAMRQGYLIKLIPTESEKVAWLHPGDWVQIPEYRTTRHSFN